jgi:nucleotide-binding universal stress UspA family protein
MHIVVGVDGSAPSLVALDLVGATAWPRGSAILLVGAAIARDASRRAQREAIERAAERLRAIGFATQVAIVPGRAADVLMAEAHASGTDLIVVGGRGLGTAASALLGSVSAALVDHAPCPVLVVRRPSVSRILVATDGSRSAEAIPSVLLAWGAFKDAAIDVVTVRPAAHGHGVELGAGIPWMLGGERRVLHAEHDVDRYDVMAEDMASRLSRAGWPARPMVRRGDAAGEIEEAATESGADLIVTGSRGLSGLRRRLLGSVAHHVLLHSQSSVLVMRGHVPGRVEDLATTPTASV